ncbi:MAG: hypothetical protein IKH27_00630 [Oscillospiraceae bacterium]|nr:hypothetical protein [Oscillospiraceae bacterium]MBR3446299.1 hypothetical protein [Oscillospiraceae bacterium]
MDNYTSNNGAIINKEDYYPQDSGKPVKETAGSFSSFFKEKRKALCQKTYSRISTEDIGLMLDIDYESFRKIINKQKQTKKRDCIIAICAVLGCDGTATNAALSLYGFPILDEYHRRDEIIWDALVKNPGLPVSIEALNDALTAKSFAPLDIYTHRGTEKKEFPYKLVRRQFQCSLEGIGQFNDPESFLDLRYDTECFYNMRTCMEYLGGGRLFEVCIQYEEPHRDVAQNIWQIGIQRRICPKRRKYILYIYPTEEQASEVEEYERLDDTGKFRSCFLEIEKTERAERQRICDQVNDTRNYGSRISAKVIESELHIFCETYNCDVPELAEYYLMDYCGGEYTLYILNQSCFMQMYLSEEQYAQIYSRMSAFRILYMRNTWDDAYGTNAGKLRDPVLDQYSSEEEIADSVYEARDIGTFETYSENVMTGLRLKAYRKMKAEIDDMMRKLKNGTAHICNRELLGDAADSLIAAYFGLPDIEENEAEYTAEQFRDAFALGLRTVAEIGAFLHTNGSLKINEVLSLQESEGAESYV